MSQSERDQSLVRFVAEKVIAILTLALLATLLSVPAFAQIYAGVSPVTPKNARALLGKYTEQHLTMWAVTLRNAGAVKVAVSESAVLNVMSAQTPIPARQASIFVEGAVKLSAWAIAGRIVQDVSLIGAFITSSGLVAVPDAVIAGVTGFNSNVPYIASRLRSREIPAMQTFLKFAWFEPVDLDPGATAVGFIFTDRQEKPHYNSFALELPPAATMVLK